MHGEQVLASLVLVRVLGLLVGLAVEQVSTSWFANASLLTAAMTVSLQ
eukprot:CAMPEP_0115117244 /NCGR_PEP_ID=MMETSP0227-20121206/43764_1 /TAXON_ID=89957 /ORGANISM="Polarella glacialis, Strain CCMP 1383" /LENGTH=47 /DNA_ID= /DNA_START= /DNA_END= /DNA_ORIENTATION=